METHRRITFMRRASLLATLILVSSLSVVPAHSAGAFTYQFSTTIEGDYPAQASGTVVVDGAHWRIDYQPQADQVTDLNAITAADDGRLIAINDSLRTWFRLPNRDRLSIENSLFSYGQDVRVSRLRITAGPASTLTASADRAGRESHVGFSYAIASGQGEAIVRGDVAGEIVVWTSLLPETLGLPWKPLDLHTGLTQVDAALQQSLAGMTGSAFRVRVTVARTLEGGVTLRQVITRQIGPVTATGTAGGTFAVPSAYRYQEPVIGGAGVAGN
jgi:hypothetical protein